MSLAVATTNTGADFSLSHVRNVPNTRAVVPPSLAPLPCAPAKALSISSTHRIAGATDSVNLNAFSERMATLPVFIYYSYMQPGVPAHFGQERAWGAALVLIAIVMGLNLLARGIGRYFAPKTGR